MAGGKDSGMKERLAWIGVAAMALAAVAASGEVVVCGEPFLLEDVQVWNRVAEAFFRDGAGEGNAAGKGGPSLSAEEFGGGGAGIAVDKPGMPVEFLVLRGAALDGLSPDLQPALGGRREVCVAQYRSGGVAHRALYSVDDPPELLGVFRQEAEGRWTECTDGVPLPDVVEEEVADAPAADVSLPTRNHGKATASGGRRTSRGSKFLVNLGSVLGDLIFGH